MRTPELGYPYKGVILVLIVILFCAAVFYLIRRRKTSLKKTALIFGIPALLLATAPAVILGVSRYRECSQYPSSCTHQVNEPKYAEMSSYFDGNGGYECSRPIRMVSTTVGKDGRYTDFNPIDGSEAHVFCHMTSAIEFKGKLVVLRKPEVLALISKYQYKDVSIKALEFKYIQDKDYVKRLLPDYKGREIGCIIVLTTPNEKLVYLEDEDLNTFEQLDYATFEGYLNNVSPADKKLFTDNLK